MKIAFIGAGYVGLVSAAMFAHLGHNVTCIDNNHDKISALQNGKLPIYEPGLGEYINKARLAGRLSFVLSSDFDSCGSREVSQDPQESKSEEETDAIFIAVGTPPLASGEADLSYIYDATMQVAQSYSENTLIVVKSTIPPGTCKSLESMLRAKGFSHKVASNPEFLREGSAVEDFLNPDRIVIGVSDQKAEATLREIYKPLDPLIIKTDPTTSELIKYASNSFLATKIAFINEMANLCEKVDADVEMLSRGMGLDHRIGEAFLKAGPGFGGSCFPKDILALSHLAKTHEQPCHVLDAVIFSNQNRRTHMAHKISSVIGDLKEKAICVLGVTFKAGTDDVRSSPAVDIINILLQQGANVRVYDPEGAAQGARLLPKATFAKDPYEAATKAEAIVILTEWDEFKLLDFKKLHDTLAKPNMFDFRNILDGEQLQKLRFSYHRIG
jgi:UDPglucose 6-dehydrogenase